MSFGMDYSNLFQSSSSAGSGNSNFFSDYASIKNGSYRRLMKSYYGKANNAASSSSGSKSRSNNVLDKLLEEKKNPKVSKEVQEANANLTAGISSLKSSVSALQNEKTYTDTPNGSTAAEKTVSAVKDYVTNYNNLVTAAKGSTLTGTTSHVANMMNATAANKDKLAEIGVRVNANGTLTLNEAKLKTVDTSKVQEVFSKDDKMSYGSAVASRLRFAGSSSTTSTSSKTDSSTGTDTKVTSSAANLKADGNKLASDDLYAMVKDKDGNEKYDVDKIYAAAKSFVSNYNGMFDSAESRFNSGVTANLSYIREKTAKNADVLKQFGITVGAKGRLQMDADTFKDSDMSKVQKFFKNYGASIASNASLVDYYQTTQASAANSYTADATYNVQGSARYASSV